MVSSLIPIPPRRVTIDDAATFVGSTVKEIRRYHESGLLPEPERGSDDRRYGYDEMIRLMWLRKMTDAGIAVDEIRDAVANSTVTAADVASPVHLAVLSDFVTGRLAGLPAGSLRQADLDILLVTEWIFSPLGAAMQADRFIALATNPGLRAESDRVEAAEEALDDAVALDDPRVAQVAAERHAFEQTLLAVIEDDGGYAADPGSGAGRESLSITDAVGMMPYDWSPARLRCMELAVELAAQESPAS